MIREEFFNKYAKLSLGTGVNLKKGMCLQILTGEDDYQFAKLLGQEAYKMGAKFVQIIIDDQDLVKARVENQKLDELNYVPEYQRVAPIVMTAEKWAAIRITNTAQDGVTSTVDPDKLSHYSKVVTQVEMIFRQTRMASKTPWLVIASPNKKWADKIYGNPTNSNDVSNQNLEKLFVVLEKILKLDASDPQKAWFDDMDNLKVRAKKLDTFELSYLHFLSKGTDLKIYLNEKSRFSREDRVMEFKFLANIPTAEIGTTPNFRKTEGKVAVTRPVAVLGNSVEGASFEFKDGKVVSFDAKKNKDILARLLDTDEGARYLGEVALVDVNSPIYQSGLVFSNILFDENASCHIALGRGYPTAIIGAENLQNEQELKDAGCNVSFNHVDFMIGAADTTVIGYRRDGSKVMIMENGAFVI